MARTRKHLNPIRNKNATAKKNAHGNPLRGFVLMTLDGVKCKHSIRKEATNPKAAASKAFTSWCRKTSKSGKCSAVVCIRETTRGNKKKEYCYKASRISNQQTVESNGAKNGIKYKYVNKLYSTRNYRKKSSKKKMPKAKSTNW